MHVTYVDRVSSVAFVTLKNKEGEADVRDLECREPSSALRNVIEEAEAASAGLGPSQTLPANLTWLLKEQRREDLG